MIQLNNFYQLSRTQGSTKHNQGIVFLQMVAAATMARGLLHNKGKDENNLRCIKGRLEKNRWSIMEKAFFFFFHSTPVEVVIFCPQPSPQSSRNAILSDGPLFFSLQTQICPAPFRIISVSDQSVAHHLVLSEATALPTILGSQKLELKTEKLLIPSKQYLLSSWASLSGYSLKKLPASLQFPNSEAYLLCKVITIPESRSCLLLTVRWTLFWPA